MNLAMLFGGAVLPIALFLLGRAIFYGLTVRVNDEETILVTRFGKLVSVYKTPGLH